MAKELDFEQIKSAAEAYGKDMTAFLRAMISHPSESCEEGEVVACIKAEMEKLGFDKVEVDGLGNVIGWMGEGDKIIAIDSHIDTVGIGNINNWEADPYKGFETDDVIYGRGGSDQEGGMASAVYGTKIMKDMGLIPAGYKIMVVGSVQEEDCDGMCWQYIVNKYFPANGIKKEQVEFVISTEPTDGGIYRGHRGRMEIRVDVKGISCHGSAPERGDNAIYKMADILQEVRALNENPADVEALKACTYPGTDRTVADVTADKVLAIGENIQVRRFVRYAEGVNVPYIHMGGKIGVLVNMAVEGIQADQVTELGKDIAMQIAAMNPAYLDKSDVDQATLDKEKEILLIQAKEDPKNANKPENIIEKMVMGRIGKYYEENCLLQQAFVKENKVSVEKHIAEVAKQLGGKITVKAFTRFQTGEGIEKAEEDFAAEVASMIH